MSPDGVVMLHISNDHLRLNDIVAATAATLGLSVLINDEDEDPAAKANHLYQPTVAVLANRQDGFGALQQSEDWVDPAETAKDMAPWSDQSANLLSAVIDRLANR